LGANKYQINTVWRKKEDWAFFKNIDVLGYRGLPQTGTLGSGVFVTTTNKLVSISFFRRIYASINFLLFGFYTQNAYRALSNSPFFFNRALGLTPFHKNVLPQNYESIFLSLTGVGKLNGSPRPHLFSISSP